MGASVRWVAPVALVLSGVTGSAAVVLDRPAIRPVVAEDAERNAARPAAVHRASRSGRVDRRPEPAQLVPLPGPDWLGPEAVAAAGDLAVASPAPAPGTAVQWPAAGEVSGVFAERRRRHRHPGTDINGETGDPVVAAGPGTVVHAGAAPAGYSGYGNLVVIDHGAGVQTLSAHLSWVEVGAGQVVQPGQRVGAIGTTGRVTGSHLHFEVRISGVLVDPLTWLPPRQL